MINMKIFGVTLFAVLTVAASIGLTTTGFQSTMASIMLTDLEEAVEAGNATTTMMTNQTAGGNMTGSISALGTDGHAEGEGTTPSDTCSHAEC
jgi:hypothetical protein